MNTFKRLVYAQNEEDAVRAYDAFRFDEIVRKYALLQSHVTRLWTRRQEWCMAYRTDLPLRGTHTTAIMEAGFRITKDIIFERVKAYNVVEV